MTYTRNKTFILIKMKYLFLINLGLIKTRFWVLKRKTLGFFVPYALA